MAKEIAPQGVKPPDQKELVAAFEGPAVLSNKVYVTVGPSGVFFAFCEAVTPEVIHLRTRVVMPYQDAMQFAELLEKMLAPLREAFESAPTISVKVETQKDG